MNTKISALVSLFVSLSIGVLVTTPTFNSGQLDLPAAISDVPESSVIARIGTVVGIVESDNIIVAISGPPTLVRASYLFPAYEPLLGDRVYLTKQDAQWAVLGTLSGPLNTVVPNANFENGVVSTTPDQWIATPVVTTAGTPTFRKETVSGISGSHNGVFRNSSAGTPGNSSIDIFSTQTPALPDQRWAMGYYITYAVPDVNASLESQGGYMELSGFIQFLDASDILITETLATFTPIYSSVLDPVYIRTSTVPGQGFFAQAPAGTVSVRLRIRALFTMHVNSASEIGIDVMLLRTA